MGVYRESNLDVTILHYFVNKSLHLLFCSRDGASLLFQLSMAIYHWKMTSVQLFSRIQLFVTPWTAARQASLSITNSRSLLKIMPMELVMPSNHLILCHTLFLLPSIFPSIRVFSNKSALHIKWPKYWSFSFNVCPSNEYFLKD